MHIYYKMFSIWVKFAPRPGRLLFWPGWVSYIREGQRSLLRKGRQEETGSLGTQREMAYFMNCTITAFFNSWGNKYPTHCLLTKLFWNSSERKDCCCRNMGGKLEDTSFHVFHRVHFPHISIIDTHTHVSMWNTDACVGTAVHGTFLENAELKKYI